MTHAQFQRSFGPWALVTGASDGIGRAIALEIARRGVNLVLVARRGDVLATVAEAIRDGGAEARVVAADLATPQGHETVISRTNDLNIGLFCTRRRIRDLRIVHRS